MPDLIALSDLGICTRCLGRVFASVGESLDNVQRGQMLLFTIKSLHPEATLSITDSNECPLCNGVFDEFEKYMSIVMDEIEGVEYNSFLIGSVFEKSVIIREEEIQSIFGSRGESMKKEFNRECGKHFDEITGKEVSFSEPDLTVIVDTRYDFAKTDIRSIYICGRYNKFRRDLPQTRWIHKPENNESVEYYIGEPVSEASHGENFFLHAAGREDVDVRMLGEGRDFVLEISRPKKRDLNLGALEKTINMAGSGVSVRGLEFCSKDRVKEVKSTTFDKTYRVVVHSGNDLDGERLQTALQNITGKVIYQRTPLRVAVRRADLIRERSIRESAIEQVTGKTATLLLKAESGMYIKELVNGDNQRTNPSLSSEYGESLAVAELDVVEINRGK